MSFTPVSLLVIFILKCNSQDTREIRCNETIFGSIDVLGERDFFDVIELDFNTLSVTINACDTVNNDLFVNFDSSIDFDFQERNCPNNASIEFAFFVPEVLLGRLGTPNFNFFIFDFLNQRVGNYSFTVECAPFATDPVIVECGDIVNTSLSRNEVDRYILSGCNEIENITFSTCGGITEFDTQIRVDSFTQVSQVGYNDEAEVTCAPTSASQVTIQSSDVSTFNDDFVIRIAGFDESSNGDYTLTINCAFNDPSLSSCPPTVAPSLTPTLNPTLNPTLSPTLTPTEYPTISPTNNPTLEPTLKPSNHPTDEDGEANIPEIDIDIDVEGEGE
mmetsp:Transcript_88224/g.108034  ORF Transcript_88224/g.108034 Transcript_88224/m.108034 type:complete len:332 (+) Transcript_88224:106-1101(+)